MAISTRKRLAILFRDNFTCLYCEQVFLASELTLDHLQPISKGGKDNPRNLVAACSPCNHFKGDREWSGYSKVYKKDVKERRRRCFPRFEKLTEALLLIHGPSGAVERLDEVASMLRASARVRNVRFQSRKARQGDLSLREMQ